MCDTNFSCLTVSSCTTVLNDIVRVDVLISLTQKINLLEEGRQSTSILQHPRLRGIKDKNINVEIKGRSINKDSVRI